MVHVSNATRVPFQVLATLAQITSYDNTLFPYCLGKRTLLTTIPWLNDTLGIAYPLTLFTWLQVSIVLGCQRIMVDW